MIDQAAWDQTVRSSPADQEPDGKTVLTKAPDAEAYTNDYVTKALDELKTDEVDVTGASFKPLTVTLNEGGA